MDEQFPVNDKKYHVCKSRNHLFYHENLKKCSCPDGNNDRFQNDGVTPVETMSQLPLYKQLATYFDTEGSRNNLLYRINRLPNQQHGYHSSDTIFTGQVDSDRLRLGIESTLGRGVADVFDGSLYQKYKHLFTSDYDLALALYIDGFSPQKRGAITMVTCMAVILNLPPDIRYVIRTVLLVL